MNSQKGGASSIQQGENFRTEPFQFDKESFKMEWFFSSPHWNCENTNSCN